MAIIIKNAEQIAGIRKSCKLAAATLKFIAPHVVPGVTTEHLNQLVEQYIVEHGAVPAPLNYRGFPKATCISINEVVCHGIPGEQVLHEGDIVNIDVTTILDGYFGDTSATFAVGKISADAQKLLDITKQCLEVGIAEVRPGAHLSNIGYAITKLAEQHDMGVVTSYAGHGCGVLFHEDPLICHHATRRGQGPQLKPGMTFTIEPMINQGGNGRVVLDEGDKWTVRTADNKLSAQFEHQVLVTNDGVEVMTYE